MLLVSISAENHCNNRRMITKTFMHANSIIYLHDRNDHNYQPPDNSHQQTLYRSFTNTDSNSSIAVAESF